MYYFFSLNTTNEWGHKYCLELLTELSITYKSRLNSAYGEWIDEELYSNITFVNIHKRKHDPIFLNKDDMYDEILDITRRFAVEHMDKLRACYVEVFLHMKFDEPIVVLPSKIIEECKRLDIPMTDTIQSNLGPFGQ